MFMLADDLVDRVNQTITRYSMLSSGDRVGVAVSGGADSVVLLHLLSALSGKWKITLMALHINHKLRGAESDNDEEFVRTLAQSLGLAIDVQSGPVISKSGNLEQSAREIRQSVLLEAKSKHLLQRIALGHSRSDQAETVLFRLLRGSGPTGLAGMPYSNTSGLIRPLLGTSRTIIREYASQNGISYRHDSSNDDIRFARNRIRLRTIPRLSAEYNRNLEGVLAWTAELLAADEAYWARKIERLYRKLAKPGRLGPVLSRIELARRDLAVQRRLIRAAIRQVRGNLRSIEFGHVDAILELCNSDFGHHRTIIPEVDVIRSFDSVLFTAPGALNEQRDYQIPVVFGIWCELPFGAGSLRIDSVLKDSESYVNVNSGLDFLAEQALLDGDRLRSYWPGSLTVRNWQPGDSLQVAGHRASKKVKTLFQEGKVALWDRRHWPVVVAGKEIIWVRGFGPSETFSISDDSCQMLRIAFRSGG